MAIGAGTRRCGGFLVRRFTPAVLVGPHPFTVSAHGHRHAWLAFAFLVVSVDSAAAGVDVLGYSKG